VAVRVREVPFSVAIDRAATGSIGLFARLPSLSVAEAVNCPSPTVLLVNQVPLV